MLQITALMDDKPSSNPALAAEHGLSFYVACNGLRLLFDCGPGPGFLENAHALGIDLKDLDGVIISHSHHDHAGGYPDLVEQGLGSDLLCTGPHFFEPKFAREGTGHKDISCGFDRDFLEAKGIRHREITGVAEIHPGVWLFSGFPRLHSFETIPERFIRQSAEGIIPDDFPDEVCMALEVEGGLTVLVGCSHPGILNMLTQIQAVLNKPIRAVFGGTHLVSADDARIEATVSKLREMGLELIGLSHCTGEAAENIIAAKQEVRSCHLCPGDRIRFE